MIKKATLLIVMLSGIEGLCQNLVPNGDFEQHTGCPINPSQLYLAPPWINPVLSPPTVSTPDYFNVCSTTIFGVPTNFAGFQVAHSGVAYVGIVLWSSAISHHEFIEVPLVTTLSMDSCYYFEMFVNLSNVSNYTSDNIGIYFSDTLITGYTSFQPLPYSPQLISQVGFVSDTLNWTLISGTYIATGGENYIIIGNYNSDQTTNLLQVNNISGNNFVYFYIDDVSIQLTACTGLEDQINNLNIKIYPNPFAEKIIFEKSDNILSEISILDIYSRKLIQQKFERRTEINASELPKGIYLYNINIGNKIVRQGKIIKN